MEAGGTRDGDALRLAAAPPLAAAPLRCGRGDEGGCGGCGVATGAVSLGGGAAAAGGGALGAIRSTLPGGGACGGRGGGVEADNLKASDGWLPFDDDGDDGDELDQVLDHSLVLTSGEREHELERERDIDGTREEWLLKAVVVSLSILFALHLIRRAWPTIGPHLRHRWLMCDSRACLHRCTARLLSALAGGGRAGGGRAHEHRPLRISAEGMAAEGQLSPTSEPTTPRGPEALAAEAAAERAWLEDWLQRSKASAFHH